MRTHMVCFCLFCLNIKNISNSIFFLTSFFFLQIVVITTATMKKNNELTAEQRGATFIFVKMVFV